MPDSSSATGSAPPPYADPDLSLKPPGSPFGLPFKAWRRAGMRTAGGFGDDNLGLVAAGCAFFTMLALFPALSAIVSLYGLIASPAQVSQHLSGLSGVIPGDAFSLIERQTERLATQGSPRLGLSFAVTLTLSIWGTTRTTRALTGALNIVYDEKEHRGILRLNAQILAVTLGAVVIMTLGLLFIAALPVLIDQTVISPFRETLLDLARWPFLLLIVGAGLLGLYRLAPSRADARWLWLLPGAGAAAVLWIAASWLFSAYVARIADYNSVYGSFGALVILILWMYWSFLIVLLGAELNAELEREVARDTTTGPVEPMGQRGAVVADTVAKRKGNVDN